MDKISKDLYKEIQAIKNRMEELPKGYISKKNINGKERFYLQWREGEKVKSKYIRAGELESISRGIEERRALEKELKLLEMRRAGIGAGIEAAMETGLSALEYTAFDPIGNNRGVYVRDEMAPYFARDTYYLKWKDEVIGVVGEGRAVRFLKPDFNALISVYTRGKSFWTGEEFISFLSERIISRERRDIESILRKLELQEYDIFRIALKTCAVNARDMLWLSEKEDEKMSDAVSRVFDSIFNKKKDLKGDSVDTPEGASIKRYGVFRNKYGIYKQRISPMSTDLESEIAVYKIGEIMGVPCCPCYRVSQDEIFSAFKYNFADEYIVHFRRLVDNPRGENELYNLIKARPEYLPYFAKMIALDFVTRQDDRHLSNLAVKISEKNGAWKESFYPLYDNGRSLFYEDTEETVKRATSDVGKYSTTFGAEGTYLDHVRELARMGLEFKKVVNLNIKRKDVEEVLESAGLTGYRLRGSLAWIMECIRILKNA